MKTLICVLATSAIASFAPSIASAADLGLYEERETVIERPAPVIEHERIVERRYYEPYDEYIDDEPDVVYYSRPYRRPYFYAGYPYRFGHYGHGHWRHRHARW